LIRFTVEGQGTIEARPGQTLVEAAQEGGLVLPFGCLSAKCGVCLVEADAGVEPAAQGEALTLRSFGCPPGQRLACQARLAGDAVVRRVQPEC
jgi:ferredoxin